MAAAAAALKSQKNRDVKIPASAWGSNSLKSANASVGSGKKPKWKRRNSLSLHVRDERMPDGEDPIVAIESIACKDSKGDASGMLKLSSQDAWQPRRMICTSQRLYLLTSRRINRGKESEFEIADSIPLREIVGIAEITPDTIKQARRAETIASKTSSIVGVISVKIADQFSINKSADSFAESSAMKFSEAYQQNAKKRDFEAIFQTVSMDSAFEIRTESDGFNQGAVFWFSAGSKESREEWISKLQEINAVARKAFERKNKVKKLQGKAQKVFKSAIYQALVVLAITANFLVTIAQSQVKGASGGCGANVTLHAANDTDSSASMFDKIDIAFTIIFVAELLFNFAANAFWPFVLSRWNWFDVVIVFTSVGLLFVSTASNGVVKLARILRVFRVFRLFGRISQLREIVNAISCAILPAFQALLIGVFVVAIYAAIGTEFFADEKPDGFCDFFHAFYTLFSIIAFSDKEHLIDAFDDQGRVRFGHVTYIYSFVAIVIFVLLQVVVAVLLDSFYRARQRDGEQVAREAAARERMLSAAQHPLDPLLEQIVSTFDTAEDLTMRLNQIFNAFDTDGTGTLSFYELYAGLFKYNGVRLTFEHFEKLTEGMALCNEARELDAGQFRRLMVRQLRAFTQRRMAESMFLANLGAEMVSVLTTLKLVMVELDQIGGETEGLAPSVRRQERIEGDMLALGRKLDALLDAVVAAGPAPAYEHPAEGAGLDLVCKDLASLPQQQQRDAAHPPAGAEHALFAHGGARNGSPGNGEANGVRRRYIRANSLASIGSLPDGEGNEGSERMGDRDHDAGEPAGAEMTCVAQTWLA